MSLEPYYQDNYITEYHGHTLDVLKNLLDNSIQCCVTSPPYWGLRDYNLEPQIWDGQEGCRHEWVEHYQSAKGGKNHPDRPSMCGANRHMSTLDIRGVGVKSDFCQLCGAWRGSLGLEPTPELYIQHIVQIFMEVKRLLRKDGTCWLNIGDSYWGGKGQSGHGNPEFQQERFDKGISFNVSASHVAGQGLTRPQDGKHATYKPKDLCMIPARVALALQADGWWLRSDIIWAKPNPMPESVTDRPTNSYEHIFLLTKSAKYFYDADAVREKLETPIHKPGNKLHVDKISGPNDRGGHSQWEDTMIREWGNPKGRNLRNVWNIATEPTPEAHFATFPKKLASTCIKAGSKIGDVVLDPFSGSGKTMMMAKQLRRKGIGIDLNSDYLDMPKRRLAQEVIPFN